MARRDRAAGDESADSNAWMVTFSDLLNLLLTFFVLLLTMSSLDSKKLKESFGFFDEVVGGLGQRSAAEVAPPTRQLIPPILPTALYRDLRSYLAGGHKTRTPKNLDLVRRKLSMLGLESLLQLQEAVDGLRFSLEGRYFFAPGSDRVEPAALPFLGEVALMARDSGRQLLVECFWDDRADESDAVPSKLAIDRAARIGSLLVADLDFPGEDVAVSSAGAPQQGERGRVRFTFLEGP